MIAVSFAYVFHFFRLVHEHHFFITTRNCVNCINLIKFDIYFFIFFFVLKVIVRSLDNNLNNFITCFQHIVNGQCRIYQRGFRQNSYYFIPHKYIRIYISYTLFFPYHNFNIPSIPFSGGVPIPCDASRQFSCGSSYI